MRVLLMGMMGSGKSSVGRALATLTGWPFFDNDVLVQRATGRTARELLETDGVDALRAAEATAFRAGLQIDPPAIVAIAAGVVLEPADRSRMAEGGFTVWLRAHADVLAARSAGASHRPWLEGDAQAWFRDRLAERSPLYAEVADLEIDTSVTSPDEAASLIVSALPDTVPAR